MKSVHLVSLGIILMAAISCGVSESKSENQSSKGASQPQNQADKVADNSLTIENPIKVGEPSANSLKYFITVKRGTNPYGEGFVLKITERNYSGCESHTIFDLDSKELYGSPTDYGNPSCSAATLPEKVVYEKGSSEYAAKLQEITDFLVRVRDGFNAPSGPEPRVAPIADYLLSL